MRARAKRRQHQGGGDHRDRWMITYADLITLLLIFFVVMYAMSSLDAKKYDVVVQSLQDTFHKGDSILEQGSGITGTADRYTSKNPPTTKQPSSDNKAAGPTKLTEREQAFRKQEKELQNLMSVIEQYISDNKLQGQIFVSDQPRGIVITLNDRFLFDQGRAALKQGSANTLSKLYQSVPGFENADQHRGPYGQYSVHTLFERFDLQGQLGAFRGTGAIRASILSRQRRIISYRISIRRLCRYTTGWR